MRKGPVFFQWLHVLVGVLCLSLFIGIGSYVYAMSPTAAARAFLQKLQEQDVVGAYALTSVQWQQQTSLETFERFLKLYPVPVDASGFVGSIQTQEDTVMYKGMYLNKEKGVGFEVDLVSEGGVWKVLSFHMDLPQS